MRTVSAGSVAAGQERVEELPASVQEALGELAGAAKEGLLALSVGVGLGVLHELMEAEVCEVVGPRGKHDPDRSAVRHGHDRGEVTLGGRRVPVERPRARSADGEHEVELATYAHFAARDRLTDVMLQRMLAGVSTRRYARTGEPVGAEIDQVSRSTSKSAVSREFVSRTREQLIDLMSRPLDDLRLAVVMLDGIDLKGRCCVVALGIDSDGVKHPLGCGTARPRTPPSPPRCWPTSSSAAWMSSRACWSSSTAPRRCARPSAMSSAPTRRSSAACVTRSATCSATCPSATGRRCAGGCGWRGRSMITIARSTSSACSPQSWIAATPALLRRCARACRRRSLTVTRLGIRGQLKRTLASTNPCESMIETVRRISRNVKRWQSGDMCLRWTAAGMLEAQAQFRRMIGHGDLAKLAIAVERDVAAKRATATRSEPLQTPIRTAAPEVAATPPEIIHSQDRRREVPRRPGHPPPDCS